MPLLSKRWPSNCAAPRGRRWGAAGEVVSSGQPALDALLAEGGFRRGALVEWLASGPAGGAVTLALTCLRAALAAGGVLVVIDRRRRFYPPAAVHLGIALEQLIVVRPTSQADEAWALDQVLRSRGVAAAWCAIERPDEHTLRRWQLAAETSGVIGFLGATPARSEPSWAELRLGVEPIVTAAADRSRRVRVEVLRSRSGKAGGVVELEMASAIHSSSVWREEEGIHRRADHHETHLCIWLPNWPLQRLAARAEPQRRKRGQVQFSPQFREGNSPILLRRLHKIGTVPRRFRSNLPAIRAWCSTNCTLRAVPRWRPGARGYPRPPAQAWLEAGGGIRPGMPLAEATALAPFCAPGQTLHLEMFDPAADRLAIEALAEWCHAFSPTVGVEESPDAASLLLDVTGLGRLCGGEQALARRIVRAFHQRRLVARLAMADTLGAAWAVAHFAALPVAGATPDARAILAALQEPILVPEGATRAALAPLPPAALRLSAETCDLLAELGLRRIEQVASLPRETLLSRFGPLVLARLDQATGAAAEAIVARAPAPEWRFEWLFEHPTGRREMIEAAVEQLVARLCQALRESGGACCDWPAASSPSEGRPSNSSSACISPSASPRHVEELVRLKLEEVRFREPLVAVRLEVLALDQLDFRQQEFFSGGERRDSPRELAALVDRLSNRLGPRAVVQPVALGRCSGGVRLPVSTGIEPGKTPRADLCSRAKSPAAATARKLPAPIPLPRCSLARWPALAIARCTWSPSRSRWWRSP